MPTENFHNSEEGQAMDADMSRSAGVLLRDAREAKGLSEKNIADKLHITVHYVKALESDQFEKLPGNIFARGYLKSYAELVEADKAEIISRFEAITGSSGPAQSGASGLTMRSGASGHWSPQGRSSARNTRRVFASLGVFVAGSIGLWLYSSTLGDAQENQLTTTEVPLQERPTSLADTGATQTNELTPSVIAPGSGDSLAAPVNLTSNSSTLRQATSATAPSDNAALDTEREPAVERAISASDSVIDTGAGSTLEETGEETAVQSEAPIMIAASESAEVAAPAARSESTVEVTEITVHEPDASEPAIRVSELPNGDRMIAVDGQGDDVLRINFNGESWVEVNDGSAQPIYRDLRIAGDVLEITGQGPFNVLLGDAPLTQLIFNGSEVDVSDEVRIDNSARLTVGL